MFDLVHGLIRELLVINSNNQRTNPWNFLNKILRIGGFEKHCFLSRPFWFFFFFSKKNVFVFSNENIPGFHMRYHFFQKNWPIIEPKKWADLFFFDQMSNMIAKKMGKNVRFWRVQKWQNYEVKRSESEIVLHFSLKEFQNSMTARWISQLTKNSTPN